VRSCSCCRSRYRICCFQGGKGSFDNTTVFVHFVLVVIVIVIVQVSGRFAHFGGFGSVHGGRYRHFGWFGRGQIGYISPLIVVCILELDAVSTVWLLLLPMRSPQ
jgi:hypothetical protein